MPTNDFVPDVLIYVDGACSGNPGPAAYAAVLVQGQPDATTCYRLARDLHNSPVAKVDNHIAKLMTSPIGDSTSNAAELHAVLAGLAYVIRPGARILVRTDSANVVGWLTGAFKRKNSVIAEKVDAIAHLIADRNFIVAYERVKGHAGDPLNDLADSRAKAAIRR